MDVQFDARRTVRDATYRDRKERHKNLGLHASRLESVGVKLPERRVSTRELLESCRHRPRLYLEALTGIREHRACSEGEDSYTLAVDAAWDCLARSRYQASDIEMIISCSITKFCDGLSYRLEPALSLSIKEAISAGQAINFDVSNACAGMLTGVWILDSFIRSGFIRCGMVVSGEYITSISDNATYDVRHIASSQLASLTVGDAGAAAIVDRVDPGAPGISACEFVTHADHSHLCIGVPSANRAGAVMRTRASKLHRVAIASCVPPIRDALDASGLELGEIDYLIPHQTSIRAIRAGTKHIRAEMGSMAKVVYENLKDFGNTASTAHFLALDRLLREGRLRPEDRIMFLAFASGVVVGSIVLTVGELGGTHGRDH